MKEVSKPTPTRKAAGRRPKVVYKLECWVTKADGQVIIHHTNNGGFPAPGQLGNPINIHPAKLIVYESPRNFLSRTGNLI